ncbi:MAG TPA: PEP-utilizing enzyme [Solirubrobacteraceae bacterium]|nr:PEP-utilizing enzyme [Solirubrobacteraceae bacterium]
MTDTAAPVARPYPDKWARPSATPTVEAFHTAIRALVAERFAASGRAWEDCVHDPAFELTREDFEKVEADFLATGYRFEMSANVSVAEAPEKYKPQAGPAATGTGAVDEEGRPVLGTGDNVFRAKADVTGIARFVSKVETVMEMLTAGVPERTIAVIDDSGGTLTAPVLGQFTGVLCMGGTIRSHLGILTREYGVPCLMAVELDGLKDGEEIVVEYSKAAADAYADAQTTRAQRARIIKTA